MRVVPALRLCEHVRSLLFSPSLLPPAESSNHLDFYWWAARGLMESSKPSPRSKDAEFGSQMPSIAPSLLPPSRIIKSLGFLLMGQRAASMESSKPSPRSKDAEFGSQEKNGMPSIRRPRYCSSRTIKLILLFSSIEQHAASWRARNQALHRKVWVGFGCE